MAVRLRPRRIVTIVAAMYGFLLIIHKPELRLTGTPVTNSPPGAQTQYIEPFEPSHPKRVLLCLSGGGYRAMLFHLGALWRLNTLGVLPEITEISSVSGGSISAAQLGSKWSQLEFSSSGVATNFEEVIARPLRSLASLTIDSAAIVKSVLLPDSAAVYLSRNYDAQLYHGARLANLPDQPRFVFHATDLNAGRDWVFTKARIGNTYTGFLVDREFSLAKVVAASSAFPPFLSPLRLEVAVPRRDTSNDRTARYLHLSLSDGGVMDNLGLEHAGAFDAILLSDASGKSNAQDLVNGNWIQQTQRVIDLIYDQPGDLRVRSLIETYFNGVRGGTLWGIALSLDAYKSDALHSDSCLNEIRRLAAIPTRLRAIPEHDQKALINWGYISSAASLRYRARFLNHWADIQLPYPDVPLCSEGIH